MLYKTYGKGNCAVIRILNIFSLGRVKKRSRKYIVLEQADSVNS